MARLSHEYMLAMEARKKRQEAQQRAEQEAKTLKFTTKGGFEDGAKVPGLKKV